MQPRTGTWSFDDHTTSTWVPAKVGMPSPGSGRGGPSTGPEPERDESAIWDDPDESTRKLSSSDIARTLDEATDLEMDWDEDESRTQAYDPAHARAILQVSPRAGVAAAPRPQSAVRQRAVRPEDMQPPAAARQADPATAGALASIQPHSSPADRRRANSRALSQQPARANPPQARARAHTAPVLRKVTVTTGSRTPALASPIPALKPAPTQRAAPRTAPRTLPPTPPPHFSAPRSVAPHVQAASHEPRTAPLWSAGGVRLLPDPALQPSAAARPVPPRPPTLSRAPGSSPPSAVHALNAPPPLPRTATSHDHANERAWTQAWEDAQALARAHQLNGQAPDYAPTEQFEPVRHMPPPRLVVDRQPRLQPTAAGQGYEFRSAAHAAVTPLPFDAEEVELAQPLAKQEIKRLALWSAIPGIALFGAVLMGRVLLAGPAPAPEQAPSAIVAPVEVAPAVVAELVQPEQAPSTLAPAPAERRARTRDASASASRTRTHTTHEDVSSDDSASASPARAESTPRATRSPAATADEPKAAPVERTSGIGILRLNSRPWSQVFVDGKLVGNTPQMGLRLNAGSHRIELVNPQLGMSKKFKVEVQADEIVTRSEMLEE